MIYTEEQDLCTSPRQKGLMTASFLSCSVDTPTKRPTYFSRLV